MTKLNDREWKCFEIDELLKNDHGKRLVKKERSEGKLPLLTARSSNNGISSFINNRKMQVFNDFISIDMFGNSFYHPYAATGDDNIYFFLNDSISPEAKLFISSCINKQSIRFSYGKQFRQHNADTLRIMLPADDKGQPDFKFMEEYVHDQKVESLYRYVGFAQRQLTKLKEHVSIPELNDKTWKEFILEDIFTIGSGVRIEKRKLKPGDRAFVSAIDNNNGVTDFVSNTNASCDRNVLGVNYDGNGMCIGFYHPYECIFLDDVKRFHLKHWHDNEYVMLFLKVVIMQQKSKFDYLYKFNAKRMARQRLLLPVTDSGDPDYEYMEQYSKNLMLNKYKQYLAFIKKHYGVAS